MESCSLLLPIKSVSKCMRSSHNGLTSYYVCSNICLIVHFELNLKIDHS